MDKVGKQTLKTKNIKEALNAFAQENMVEYEKCDFSIDNIDTYIKTTASEEFKLFNEDINTTYKDEDKILNEHVEFQQIYTITIKLKTKKLIKLNYSLKFDEFSTRPKIVIQPDSKIPYKKYKPKDIYTLLKI